MIDAYLCFQAKCLLESLVKLAPLVLQRSGESLSADTEGCTKHTSLKHHVNLKRERDSDLERNGDVGSSHIKSQIKLHVVTRVGPKDMYARTTENKTENKTKC